MSKKNDLSYFLTLFRVEGHTTWRAHIAGHATGFDNQVKNDQALVTDTKRYVIDRVTGTITEI